MRLFNLRQPLPNHFIRVTCIGRARDTTCSVETSVYVVNIVVYCKCT